MNDNFVPKDIMDTISLFKAQKNVFMELCSNKRGTADISSSLTLFAIYGGTRGVIERDLDRLTEEKEEEIWKNIITGQSMMKGIKGIRK